MHAYYIYVTKISRVILKYDDMKLSTWDWCKEQWGYITSCPPNKLALILLINVNLC